MNNFIHHNEKGIQVYCPSYIVLNVISENKYGIKIDNEAGQNSILAKNAFLSNE